MKYVLDKCKIIAQAFLCTLVLQDSLTLLEWGYKVDLPIIKWFYAVTGELNCWGMESLFVMVAFYVMFSKTKESVVNKNGWVIGFSIFAAICTVFGISFMESASWDYIFHGRLQAGLAILVSVGYFFLYRNLVALLYQVFTGPIFTRRKSANKVETFLFDKYPFLGPLAVIAAACLPTLIFFFPGTLQWDAHAQLWAYLKVIPWTYNHPPLVTLLMGKCMDLGVLIFDSQTMGLFLFCGAQYVTQWLIFAYAISVLSKMKLPLSLRWASLLYFGFFPLWQCWGYTCVKDTGYYLGILLLVTVVMDWYMEKKPHWWQPVLLLIATVVIMSFRNNGLYVVVGFMIVGMLLYRKFWQYFLVCAAGMLLTIGAEKLCIKVYDIQDVIVAETLSLPLQQTARYLKDHSDELTEEEIESLQPLFLESLQTIADIYKPELSDPVKGAFIRKPTEEDMNTYFRIWWQQFKKHPETYIEATVNHIYGNFAPDRKCFHEGIGNYKIGNSQHWQDGYLDIQFKVKNPAWRNMIEQTARLVDRLPVVSLLYSCGFHNYIMFGCALLLIAKKKYKELFILAPGFVSLLICMASPVDAYIRYTLPVMVCMPMHLGWSLFFGCKFQDDDILD